MNENCVFVKAVRPVVVRYTRRRVKSVRQMFFFSRSAVSFFFVRLTPGRAKEKFSLPVVRFKFNVIASGRGLRAFDDGGRDSRSGFYPCFFSSFFYLDRFVTFIADENITPKPPDIRITSADYRNTTLSLFFFFMFFDQNFDLNN